MSLQQNLDKVNSVLDFISPLAGKVGMGIAGILALYNTFRANAPDPTPYPELTTLQLAELLKARANQFLADVQADRDALYSDPDQ
jgi:hypothetical protein